MQSFGAYVAVLSEAGLESRRAVRRRRHCIVEAACSARRWAWIMDRFGRDHDTDRHADFRCGYPALSQIDSLGGFYFCAVLMAIGASLGVTFRSRCADPLVAIATPRALSIMSLGLALGGVMVPWLAWCIAAISDCAPPRSAPGSSSSASVAAGIRDPRRPQDIVNRGRRAAGPPLARRPTRAPHRPLEFTARQRCAARVMAARARTRFCALVVHGRQRPWRSRI